MYCQVKLSSSTTCEKELLVGAVHGLEEDRVGLLVVADLTKIE